MLGMTCAALTELLSSLGQALNTLPAKKHCSDYMTNRMYSVIQGIHVVINTLKIPNPVRCSEIINGNVGNFIIVGLVYWHVQIINVIRY